MGTGNITSVGDVSDLFAAATRRVGDGSEVAGWRGSQGERVFTVRHLPPSPRAGLVVCGPVGGEGDSNYRREVLLARELARRGLATQRLHWRGTGNSDGDPRDLTFATMVADACQAVDDLRALVDGPVLVLGTRLSGYVAADAVARTGAQALALWQPPGTGAAYFRELGRLLRVNKLAQAAGGAVEAPRSFQQEIEADGVSEIGGYQIHRSYHDSMASRSLSDAALAPGTAVQVVQFGGSSLAPGVQDRADAWASAGCEVSTQVLDDSETWWFAPDDSAEDRRPVTVAAVAATADWCTERSRRDAPSARGVAPAAAAATPPRAARAPVETAHYVRAGDDDLLAIVTEPTAPPRRAGVVIAYGGRFGNTSGRNAVGHRLATELAAAGLHTVRLDYHGVGDSTGSIDEFVLHEPFVEDLAAAVAALRGYPVDTIGALGDCFGARTALATCAAGAGIDALLLVSLPWRDLARSDRKAHIASSELSVGDYARKGARPSTLLKLRDAGYRRAAARLVSAKSRQLVRRVADRAGDVGVEPWVSRRVLDQLDTVRSDATPALLLYGRGPAEDYTNDFERIRGMRGVTWIDEGATSVRARVLDQPIAGFRNVVSQREVVHAAVDWFADVLPVAAPVGPPAPAGSSGS
jgi:alpha-beta hydrolase superfamily lysophospholipase